MGPDFPLVGDSGPEDAPPADDAPETPAQKPGWQTTEMWVTVVTLLVATLVGFGVVSPSEKASLESTLAHAAESAVALVTAGAVVWRYIAARQAIKTS